LNASDILNTVDVRVVPLVIPEWNNLEVCIRSHDGHARAIIEAEYAKTPRPTTLTATIACLSLSDEAGNPLFEYTPANVQLLAKKSGVALDRILIAASDLNSLTPQAIEDEKETLPEITP